MKKKLLMAFILGISFSGNAQDLSKWQIGINANPFFFSRNNADDYPEKSKQDLLNGYGFGITLEKNWNEHWGFKTGVEYSFQNQKYGVRLGGGPNPGDMFSEFYYTKIPLTVQYATPLFLDKPIFLTFNQGLQLSILNDYKTVQTGSYQQITQTPNNYDVVSFIGQPSIHINEKEWIYKKTLYGIVGSVGLKDVISNKISLSANLRYEYDFASADNVAYYLGGSSDTKNFRIGFELGLQYHFSLGGCSYCKNQKH